MSASEWWRRFWHYGHFASRKAVYDFVYDGGFAGTGAACYTDY